jgi:alkylation response protein AidB-like acyl-CoA dehydrogenase
VAQRVDADSNADPPGDALNFNLSEEQQLLRDAVERFASERYDVPKRAAYRTNPAGYSAENWAELAGLGVLALPFDAEDGGLGGGAVELMTVMEALGRALAIEPVLEEIVISAGLIAAAGTAEQKARWLPAVIAGEAHLALAHVERSARFDLDDVRTTARVANGVATLDGDKSFVPAGAAADAYLVAARQAGTDGRADIRHYVVAADATGLERKTFRLVDGSVASQLTLRGVRGEPLAGGFEQFSQVVERAQIAAAAEMLGIMSLLFDSTLEYVRNRRQFGAPLGSFQVIQHRMVDLYVMLELSRSQLYRAALVAGERERARAVAGMKSYLSTSGVSMGEQCIHLHGAMGTTDELAIGHAHKRLLVLATLFGDADHELDRFIALAEPASGA